MRYFTGILGLFLLFSCGTKKQNKLEKGIYRAVLNAKENQKTPFNFEVKNDSLLHIFNASEIIEVTKISYLNDSVKIQLPVFKSYIIAKIHDNNVLKGKFINTSLKRMQPFEASLNANRFLNAQQTSINVTGKWQTTFSKNDKKNRFLANGMFKQEGNKVSGTFNTPTGDFRYLEGVLDKDSLKLSSFDGVHAFLFKAKATDSTLHGMFYSGNHWKQPFEATLNNDYKLPASENSTYIKKGYESFDFSFPDERSRIISLSDPKFQNKVVLVQVMGTWCPNSLDQTKFLTNYVKTNPHEKLEIVSLSFEITKDREIAYENINRLKDEIGVPYPILLAQFGKNASKKAALEKLPMINALISYPTLMILDTKGKVRKIYSSFTGPATGDTFESFATEFDNLVQQLLEESE